MTTAFAKVWKHFLPEDQYHTFARGAYFSSDVIPGDLAVISLNTLYFYRSNSVVDGCPIKKRTSDPGTEELAWLVAQLQRFRAQKMQVWMTGHVPPSPGNWYPNCFSRYAEISLAFQDTILG